MVNILYNLGISYILRLGYIILISYGSKWDANPSMNPDSSKSPQPQIISNHDLGGLEQFLFFHILGMSSSQVTFIFFRGVEATNQRFIIYEFFICIQTVISNRDI